MPDPARLAQLVVEELADALPTTAEEEAIAALEAWGIDTIYVAEKATLLGVVEMALERAEDEERAPMPDPTPSPERDWPDLIRRLTAWQRETFPDQGPGPVARHLEEEAGEVAESPTDSEEWADCFMLVVCGADRAGVDLYAAVEAKLATCQESEWEKVEGGYSKRVKP